MGDGKGARELPALAGACPVVSDGISRARGLVLRPPHHAVYRKASARSRAPLRKRPPWRRLIPQARGRALWFLNTPLLGHGSGDTCIGLTAIARPMLAWRHLVDSIGKLRAMRQTNRLATFIRRSVRWHQRRQPTKPQARGFRLVVTEHPRLNDLVRLAPHRRQDRHRLFDGDAADMIGTAHNLHDEGDAELLASVHALRGEMLGATDRRMRAWWVENPDIPWVVDHVEHAALIVLTVLSRRQQITRHGVVPARRERIANGS